jgi:hypothetical protein
MNEYYDKYLKYKKKYLDLHSQLAGSFNSPTRAGSFNLPPAGSFNSPPAGSFNSPPAESFNSPPESFNSPPPESFNSPPAASNQRIQRRALPNLRIQQPESFNSPPAESFNSPQAESFNSPPAESFNSPPAGSNRRIQRRALPNLRIQPPETLNPRTPINTPPESPNLRNKNTIKTDSRSKDEINNEIIKLVNISYGNNWLLTGSLAIIKYQKALGISSGLVANDVDILIVCQGRSNLWNIEATEIGNYKKVQKTIEKSVTFKNGKNSFDVTCIGNLPKYNIIDGIKVLSPIILLYYYNFDERNQDKEKIIILEKIIEIINQGYTKFIL